MAVAPGLPSSSDKALGVPICAFQGEAGAAGLQSHPDLWGWGGGPSVSLPLVKLQEDLLGGTDGHLLGVDGFMSVPWGKDGRQMFCVGWCQPLPVVHQSRAEAEGCRAWRTNAFWS